jgi:phosphate ABC transporter, permease protein PstC
MSKHRLETAAGWVFALSGLVAVLAIILISAFIFSSAFSTIATIGLKEFLLGKTWRPGAGLYGILPMIIGSFQLTGLALLFGLPVGLFTAVFISRYSKGRVKSLMVSAINLLSGIPSVVFGFFGIMVVVPLIRALFGGDGNSMLSGSLILSFMILPTIISVSVPALDAADASYYEGALALGADHEEAVFKIILPSARSGITAAVVLAIGRAIGEATAVVMVAGNQPRLTASVLKGVRTMTGNIIIEMGYATDLHQAALIATGAVLFLFIFIINFLIFRLKKKGEKA